MRRSSLGWVLVALWAVGTGCNDGNGELPPNADLYRVEGYVTDARDGSPVAGATVTFRSDALDEASTDTDEEGFYVLEVASHHPFGVVRAEKEGYRPTQADLYFDTPVRRLDLELQPASGSE